MGRELISVVIPCYKGGRYLARAIESCLRQSYDAIEVIVVDDASPDDCAAIAERYAAADGRVRLIRRPENGGVSRAFNTGFEAARGEFLTRLAQDDRFGESALAAMRSRLVERPEAGLVYCDFEVIDEHDAVVDAVRVPEPGRALIPRNRMGLCVMWRRAVWDAVGEFDPAFDTAEDYEYWLRASARFAIVRCEGRGLFFNRRHEEMGTQRFYARQERATLAALRSSFRGEPRHRGRALRKAMGYVTCTAACDYSAAGRHVEALARVARSFLLWPAPYDRRDVRAGFSRPRILLGIVARMARSALRAGRPASAAPAPPSPRGRVE